MQTYDLHVRMTQQQSDTDWNQLPKLAQKLDFAGLAIESPHSFPKKFLDEGLDIFQRFTLIPRSAARLQLRVKKYRKQADLLVIHGRTKPIWLAAAEIAAVDMVMLRNTEDFMVIDSQIARAMRNAHKPVEVCLHGLLTLKGSTRSRLMRVMGVAMEHLVRADCPLILTSGATKLCELRAPRDLSALGFLASIPELVAKNAIYQEPSDLISKIKSSPPFRSSKSSRRKA